jgi:hypothetical protein
LLPQAMDIVTICAEIDGIILHWLLPFFKQRVRAARMQL